MTMTTGGGVSSRIPYLLSFLDGIECEPGRVTPRVLRAHLVEIRDALAASIPPADSQQFDAESELRQLWWLGHGCGIAALYGDDGEMQCGICRVDFKRDSLATLSAHVRSKKAEMLAKAVAVDSQQREALVAWIDALSQPLQVILTEVGNVGAVISDSDESYESIISIARNAERAAAVITEMRTAAKESR